MENIRPTEGYLGAWNAVNQANKPKMGYASVTAMKQERFSNDKLEAVYYVRRRGALAQLVHSFLWTVSPGYRNKKLENRHALLNMIEDQIRTSSGQQAEYAYNGKKSYRGVEVSDGHKPALGDRPSQAHREVWKDGQPPGELPEKVKTALKRAERNIGDRQAFLDSLHRVFLTAAAHLAPDEANGLVGQETQEEILQAPAPDSDSTQQPQDLRAEMQKRASEWDTQAALTLAIKNEHWKTRQTRGGRIEPDDFRDITARHTRDSAVEPGGAFSGTAIRGGPRDPEDPRIMGRRRSLPSVPRDSRPESTIDIEGTGFTNEGLRDPSGRPETVAPNPDDIYATVDRTQQGGAAQGTAQEASSAPPPKPPRRPTSVNEPKTPVAAPRTKTSAQPSRDMENADKDVIGPVNPPKAPPSETRL